MPLLRKGTEGEGHRDAEQAGVEPCGHGGSQVLGEGETLHDPAAFLLAELGDGGHAKLFLLTECQDDAGLIHGGDGGRGAVGQEQKGQTLGSRRDLLDDDRDLLVSGGVPVLEALEAIEDFVGALGGAHDPQGESGKHRGLRHTGGDARAYALKAHPQRADREKDRLAVLDKVCGHEELLTSGCRWSR